jgi:hypothetical protein
MIETKLPIFIWILFQLYKKLDRLYKKLDSVQSQPDDNSEMTKRPDYDIEGQSTSTESVDKGSNDLPL